jgi:predicted nucleotide-binding protein
MFYHLIVEKKPEFKGEKPVNIYVFDLQKDEMISNYAAPYKKGDVFIANGYSLTKDSINRFKIVSTEQEIGILAKNETDSFARSGIIGFFRKEDIVKSDKYVKDETIKILKEIDEAITLVKTFSSSSSNQNAKYVFIVHGHDHNKVTEVENFVRSIGLEPVVLFKEADQGNTIIEKIERFANNSLYGIVLYTKCDMGYLVGHEEDKKFRARQNVIFEHGYLIAKLGRSKVCAILEDDSIERPGDISGIVYKTFDNDGNWKYNVAKEMVACGIKVDFNNIR